MSNRGRVIQETAEITSGQADQQRHVTIAEARLKALEASNQARQSQVAYAEEEAKRWYDYKVDE